LALLFHSLLLIVLPQNLLFDRLLLLVLHLLGSLFKPRLLRTNINNDATLHLSTLMGRLPVCFAPPQLPPLKAFMLLLLLHLLSGKHSLLLSVLMVHTAHPLWAFNSNF
jgi:hypothetical protein